MSDWGGRGCVLAWAGMPHYFAGGFLMFLGGSGLGLGQGAGVGRSSGWWWRSGGGVIRQESHSHWTLPCIHAKQGLMFDKFSSQPLLNNNFANTIVVIGYTLYPNDSPTYPYPIRIHLLSGPQSIYLPVGHQLCLPQ